MGLMARMMREAIHLRLRHERRCPECGGRGWSGRALRAPDGTVPVRRVMAKIQCSTCKGAGKLLIGEEIHEGTKPVQLYDYADRPVPASSSG